MRAKMSIPHDKCLDNTLKLLLEGYLFIPNRHRKYRSDLFKTRLMGQKVICMSGKRAAKLFYDKYRFTRKNVLPKRIQETLFGKKAIQTLVGAAHTNRKSLFMSFMTPSRIDLITNLTRKQWQVNSRKWENRKQITLFDEAAKLLCQAACQWTGVPLRNSEARLRAEDMSAMIDAFGAVGPRHWKGRCARNRTEHWIKGIIEDVRVKRLIVSTDTPLYIIAWHKNEKGRLLEAQVAAVELINLLRPITAIATYITFGALAIHTYPKCKSKLQSKDNNYLPMFSQEIRRYYPFGPFLGAKVRNNFIWRNYHFRKGTLVLLDLYGTNHDPRIWEKPYEFRPERFRYWDGNPFDFIPQGGGDYDKGTRCPGEWITVELLKISMDFLANHLEYRVPLQDLFYSLRRMPTLPKSRFVMSKIKRLERG